MKVVCVHVVHTGRGGVLEQHRGNTNPDIHEQAASEEVKGRPWENSYPNSDERVWVGRADVDREGSHRDSKSARKKPVKGMGVAGKGRPS